MTLYKPKWSNSSPRKNLNSAAMTYAFRNISEFIQKYEINELKAKI